MIKSDNANIVVLECALHRILSKLRLKELSGTELDARDQQIRKLASEAIRIVNSDQVYEVHECGVDFTPETATMPSKEQMPFSAYAFKSENGNRCYDRVGYLLVPKDEKN